MMDQKEHIATLCALGTVGVAAAGLAFGTDQQIDSHLLRPGKRKWPGSSGQSLSQTTSVLPLSRRSVSQPATPILHSEFLNGPSQAFDSKRLASAPRLFGSSRDFASIEEDEAPSRDSSKSRRSFMRPRTAASRSTVDKRESSSSSGWMKRLSSFSSHSTSPAPSIKVQEKEEPKLPTILDKRPATSTSSVPNKLVKRSISQRGLSHEEAQGHILRRPATSHQRSQTFREFLSRPLSNYLSNDQSSVATTPLSATRPVPDSRFWRPFFETHLPRKRRKSETAVDMSQIRVIVPPSIDPVMLLGTDLDSAHLLNDNDDGRQPPTTVPNEPVMAARRPRHSLSSLRRITSRRRNFTDPSVQVSRTAASGTIAPMHTKAPSSPVINGSASHTSPDLSGPQFTSSPPMFHFESRSSFRPRHSTSASDPPTTSSDADGRVFSDAESMDFRSDTNYDSIATRATNASYTGLKDSGLDTIFAARTSDETEAQPEMWQNLENKEPDDVHMDDSPFYNHDVKMHGIGISMTPSNPVSTTSTEEDIPIQTPPRSMSLHTDDFSVTPVPIKTQTMQIDSSPPLLPMQLESKDYDRVGEMLDDMKLDDEDVDWPTEDDSFLNFGTHSSSNRPVMSSPGIAAHSWMGKYQESIPEESGEDNKVTKPSIFDWSEHQQMSNASRPKTVHGKQGNGDRSRTSGRKGQPQLHFRSQSVPVNREAPPEDTAATSKFQTWRLGHKPVSEEWSDDFEFDDVDDIKIDSPAVDAQPAQFKDSVRSVRIPQAIIDRQPSMHIQFGQVQEFMALVEDLKRLRVKATELQILQGHGRHLWEDAESIINLATINDEDEPMLAASSPPSSDPFADIISASPNTAQIAPVARTRRPTGPGRRSVSTMTTPPIHGRARGESLAQARHFLQVMHDNRDSMAPSPQEIEIHKQKKLPFDTQDLKDLVVRSRIITRALQEEVRKAEGVQVSPQKTPLSKKAEHDLNELFRVPEPREAPSPCPPFRKPALPKSRSANSYLDGGITKQQASPFSSPIAMATMV